MSANTLSCSENSSGCRSPGLSKELDPVRCDAPCDGIPGDLGHLRESPGRLDRAGCLRAGHPAEVLEPCRSGEAMFRLGIPLRSNAATMTNSCACAASMSRSIPMTDCSSSSSNRPSRYSWSSEVRSWFAVSPKTFNSLPRVVFFISSSYQEGVTGNPSTRQESRDLCRDSLRLGQCWIQCQVSTSSAGLR